MFRFYNKNKNPFESLFLSNELYYQEIESLQAKRSAASSPHEQDAESSFTTISLKRGTFAKLLRKSLRDGSYSPGLANLADVRVRKKKRTIYQFPIVDRIVHGVLARVLLQEMGPKLSPHLYSYRKDRNWSTAVKNFTNYVRVHRREIITPQERGLYVLRTDVRRYTETIPVDNDSLLWEQLSLLTERAGEFQPKIHKLLRQAIRPEILSEDGSRYVPIMGIPFGSPISTIVFNLYLQDLDHIFHRLNQDAFYARYGDDILYAHQSLGVVEEFERRLSEELSKRRLELSKKKHSLCYFNGAGRRESSDSIVRGAHSITFLGMRINFDGTVALKKGTAKHALDELRMRMKNHNQIHKDLPQRERARKLCVLANDIFDTHIPHSTYSADLLQRCISDRRFLRDFDFEVAKIAAETLSGRRGKRAFDVISYDALRNEFGLESLCAARNIYSGGRS